MRKTVLIPFLLAGGLSSVAPAHDDIVVKGQAPKWTSKSSTPELTALCESEKDVKRKIQVCSAAVARYAREEGLPKEAQGQAAYLLAQHQAHPDDDLPIFGLHDSRQTLGRVALAGGDLKTAGEELLRSAQVPITPALQTLGPQMRLAQGLLEKGEKKPVLEYFELVEKFWKADGAKETLRKWRDEIKAGQTPSLR